jgi:hypothetical protein
MVNTTSVLTELRDAWGCDDFEVALTLAICERVDSPHSLAISMAIRAHDWELYKTLAPVPSHYTDGVLSAVLKLPDWKLFREDRLVSRMLTKSAEIPTGVATDIEAAKLFCEIESINALRLEMGSPPNAPWMLELTREVNRLLDVDGKGFLNPARLNSLVDRGRFGPGATVKPTRKEKPKQEDVPKGPLLDVASAKLRSVTTISRELRPFASTLKGEVWVSEQPNHQVSGPMELICVPKSSWIDRTISSMPNMNMFLQLGLGDLLREILLKNGCDLGNQGVNQDLAMRAFDENLATIDLSSASSWFTWQNLEGILPADLMHLLDLVRPVQWLRPDVDAIESGEHDLKSCAYTVEELHNYLPMGCGYTFALMTLYFLALVRCTVPRDLHGLCSVYGDDIIVPQQYANEVVTRLEFLGFKVNTAKSFLGGSFFESCGTEWLYGHDVLPFYLKTGKTGSGGDVKNIPIPYRVQIANKLRKWSIVKSDQSLTCDAKWRAIWEKCFQKVPPQYRPPVPMHLGDVGLITDIKSSRYELSKFALDNGWDPVYRIKYLMRRPITSLPMKFDGTVDNPVVTKNGVEKVEEIQQDPFPMLLWLMRHKTDSFTHGNPEGVGREELFCGPPYRHKPWIRRDLCIAAIDHAISLLEVTHTDPNLWKAGVHEPQFTRGSEPVKGLFGAPVVQRLFTYWPLGLEWVRTG